MLLNSVHPIAPRAAAGPRFSIGLGAGRRRGCGVVLALSLCIAAVTVAAVQPLAANELIDAVHRGDVNAVETCLRAHPSDVDLRDVEGRTALSIAAEGGSRELAAQLIAAGADVNAADRSNKTPLDYAPDDAVHKDVRALLIQHGAGAINFSHVNDTVISGVTWLIFGGIVAFGGLVFLFAVTRKKRSPEELLRDEINDQ
ncbi:MAG: ankyrin repeat domain-containing protein [Planctomycetota bacterium]